MKNKDEIKSLKSQLKRIAKKELIDYKWIIKIVIIAFFISFMFSALSEITISNVSLIIGIIILFIFIFVGILFDMIGVAVTAADIVPFNSMNSRKIKGADIAVLFKKNADKVSSFCNDVVGDICGIVSGSTGSIIATSISQTLKMDATISILIVTSVIASITIGGKALGKGFAINKSKDIVTGVSKILSIFRLKK